MTAEAEPILPALPEALQDQVNELSDAANELAEAGDLEGARARFQSAFDLFPSPALEWQGAAELLGAIGDMYFSAGQFAAARSELERAGDSVEGKQSPWLALRLGQTYLELADPRANALLVQALVEGGPELFDDEDPKYFRLASGLVPPPEGLTSWEQARLP